MPRYIVPWVTLLLIAILARRADAECPEVVRQAIVAGQSKVDKRLLAFSAVIHDATGTCTATVLNERWLLTAAHCSYAPGAKVRVGRLKRDGPPDAAVVRFVQHPDFTGNSILHDIAVAEIAPPLSLDYNFVTLHNGSEAPDDVWARTAGYGESNPANRLNTGMGTFRRVDLPIVNIPKCKESLRRANYRAPPNFDHHNYVCAGYTKDDSCGGDTCSGDSGGPLCVKTPSGLYVQIGVTSAGAKCGAEKMPGVYTAVSGHTEWVRSVVTGNVSFIDAFKKTDESKAPPTPPAQRTNPLTRTPSPIPAPSSPARSVSPSPSIPIFVTLKPAASYQPQPSASASPSTPIAITTPVQDKSKGKDVPPVLGPMPTDDLLFDEGDPRPSPEVILTTTNSGNKKARAAKGRTEVTGVTSTGAIAAIVVSSLFGVVAVLVIGLLAARVALRERVVPLQFVETDDAAPVPPPADLEAPPPGALAEMEMPASQDMNVDMSTHVNSPPPYAPTPPLA